MQKGRVDLILLPLPFQAQPPPTTGVSLQQGEQVPPGGQHGTGTGTQADVVDYVRRVERLSDTPRGVYMARYGGGDAFQTCTTAASLWLPAPARAAGTQQAMYCGAATDAVWDAVLSAHSAVMAIPEQDRVPQLPASLPAAPALQWSHQVYICSLPQSSAPVPVHVINAMAQGWLFEHELGQDHDRQGISRYPLIGVWGETDFVPPPLSTGGHTHTVDVADAGFGGTMAPADQHIHLVKEVVDLGGYSMDLSDWHVGADMARIGVDAVHGGAGWVVIVDVHAMRAIECLVVVTPTPTAIEAIGGGGTALLLQACAASVAARHPDNMGVASLLSLADGIAIGLTQPTTASALDSTAAERTQ